MPSSYDFSISLFDVGDVTMCCFSWCCFPCAIAQARTNMDGSNFLMNCASLRCVPARWLVRSVYHIPGDPMNDCLVSCFCPCCSANQLYQTTQLRGNPTPDGGSHHNRGEWKTQLGTGNARSCLYSCCCMPCAVGTMMETAMGMPWFMGCCFVDIWMARNLFRYQHRIQGNDLIEECAAPYGIICLANLLQNVCPCSLCIAHGAFAVLSMQLLEETQKRAPEESIREVRGNHLNMGYSSLGSAQGEFYMASPPQEPPSAPVAGVLVTGSAMDAPTTRPTILTTGNNTTMFPVHVEPDTVTYFYPQTVGKLQQGPY